MCVEGKQSSDPFDDTRTRAKIVLERIHSDDCGPIDLISWDGSKYFVSFIDDYTHFAMIYLIKKKSEVFKAFQEYEAMVTSMFSSIYISKLTIDQGREYLSKEQSQWYKRKGIQVEPTVAYSPQQNGVAERFNRTITEKVRTMFIESQTPKKMWSEAAMASVYIINRCPTRSMENLMTPAEMWFGVEPKFDKIRVFGCKAYAWVTHQCRKKLDARSKKSVMVGYAPNGYRILDMQKQKVIIARDVKFEETCFPFESMQNGKSEEVVTVERRHEQEGEGENEYESAVFIPEMKEDENSTIPDDGDDVNILPANDDTVVLSKDGDEDTYVFPTTEVTFPVRRGSRERRVPSKLQNYVTGLGATATNNTIPETYDEIRTLDDADKWLKAVDDELKSMTKNQVWKVVEVPKSTKLIKSKWVFRAKEDENGNQTKYKARLVAKGFQQKHGVDFFETYAPVAKLTTIHMVLAIGLHRRYIFHQLDVKTAFLNGDLQEEVYMAIPEGVKANDGMACKLNKSLYGLKQAPRCWNLKFNNYLVSLGFKRSMHDYCLYTRLCSEQNDDLIVVIYVDDLLVAGNKKSSIEKLKKDLSKRFEMSDCGILKFFLGMKIQCDNDEIKIT